MIDAWHDGLLLQSPRPIARGGPMANSSENVKRVGALSSWPSCLRVSQTFPLSARGKFWVVSHEDTKATKICFNHASQRHWERLARPAVYPW
jgi:hypothetical protein